MEKWVDVKGYEGMYQVSNEGNIRSIKNEPKIMRPHLDTKGYHRQSFYKDGKSTTIKYHRLVAQHFIPNPENKPQVNHINGIKTDNRVENLEWMTNDENMHHSKINKLRIGKMPCGENNKKTKITDEQVKYIRSVHVKSSKEFGSAALAKQFNVSVSTVNRIVLNQTHTYM